MMNERRLDRRRLTMHPLASRQHELQIDAIAVTADTALPSLPDTERPRLQRCAQRIREARRAGKPVILTFGAHLVKNGLGPLVIRLLEEGWVTHLATNGAGSIHDWEFGFIGQSTEDVRANVVQGCFGTWEETGRWLNLAVAVGALEGLGYGASVGRMASEQRLIIPDRPYLRAQLESALGGEATWETAAAAADLLSLIESHQLATGTVPLPHARLDVCMQRAAWQLGIPYTVHPGIGYDIIYTHPMNCGGAVGRTSLRDFLSYADAVSQLDGGVHLTVGSAIMAPMIFEKCMSMANNLALTEQRPILQHHYMAVVDIQDGGGWDWTLGEPPKDNPAYYLRFCKSFHRMGGQLDYLCLDNRCFLQHLYRQLVTGG